MLLLKISQWCRPSRTPTFAYASVSVRENLTTGDFIIDFEKGKGHGTTLTIALTRHEIGCLRDEIFLTIKQADARKAFLATQKPTTA
jgi:hypothetical protein